MSPSPTPPAAVAGRGAGFRISDRFLLRLRRLVAAHPYVVGSLALHAVAWAVLQALPPTAVPTPPAEIGAQAARERRQLAETGLRDLSRRVDRIARAGRELGVDDASFAAVAVGDAASSPEALADRARRMAAAIETWSRRERIAALVKLTAMSQADATRAIAAEEAAARRRLRPDAPPAETIAELERRAQATLEGRRLQLEARRDGVRVALAAPAPAPTPPPPSAPGSTGQGQAAGGIPRSRAEHLAALVRLGGPQGRVGVVGVEGGLSVNHEHVEGVAGGHVARAEEAAPDDGYRHRRHADPRIETGAPVAIPGGANGGAGGAADGVAGASGQSPAAATAVAGVTGVTGVATGRADGSHALVRAVAGAAAGTAPLRTAAGRTFGAGGTLATRVYLDTWYVIGPFAAHGAETMETSYPPEEDVDLDGAYRGLDGRLLSWQFTSRGFYPFIPPDVAEQAVWYAYTELRLDADVDVSLSVAADDRAMLWLDGRRAWTSVPGDWPWMRPPFYLRDEQVASLGLSEGRQRVHLARGRHQLLFKLYNERDHAFFSVVLEPQPS